ncbi:MAG: tRNA (adenosine(37)-N6)-dimethylallyltransferase MiaA [Rhodobacteraceae bacterium]|nr:tRNA (adenosine(37)-N6)-dimethylallyltransferase MiaA [Paracoccaceae bacterium]
MTAPPLPRLDPDRPVLIAGPTASGKSDLALRIADASGGVIINADASQVYDCWRVVTARPSPQDCARHPHRLYGHVPWNVVHSAGDWLREVAPLLRAGAGARPIIVGGTGLFFAALTQGLADIPPVPPQVRARADKMALAALRDALDPANRARVQRAWEVQQATGRGLAAWHDATPPPMLDVAACHALVLEAPRDWLSPRIATRFDRMIAAGALDEVAAMRAHHDPSLPAFRAIGVPELMAHVAGDIDLDTARDRAVIATRQYAKRQRTWFRARMAGWTPIAPG